MTACCKYLLLVFVSLLAVPAWGCSCIGSRAPEKEQVAAAYRQDALIFIGRVLRVEAVAAADTPAQGGVHSPRVRYTFAVSRYLKGQLTDSTVSITTAAQSSACGSSFPVGSQQLVYAYLLPAELTEPGYPGAAYGTSICQRTRPLNAASRAELRQLGKLAKRQ